MKKTQTTIGVLWQTLNLDQISDVASLISWQTAYEECLYDNDWWGE